MSENSTFSGVESSNKGICVKAIDTAIWDECASDQGAPEGKTAYGVKFSPNEAEIVLAEAIIPPYGEEARISLIAIEPAGRGLSWLADWLNERYKTASCVVIDGSNGADTLVGKLRPVWQLKESVIQPSPKDVARAAEMLVDDLCERKVTWFIDQEELRDSALTAIKRPISGEWGFGGPASAPIEACSLALWGCKTSRRNPQRKMMIG